MSEPRYRRHAAADWTYVLLIPSANGHLIRTSSPDYVTALCLSESCGSKVSYAIESNPSCQLSSYSMIQIAWKMHSTTKCLPSTPFLSHVPYPFFKKASRDSTQQLRSSSRHPQFLSISWFIPSRLSGANIDSTRLSGRRNTSTADWFSSRLEYGSPSSFTPHWYRHRNASVRDLVMSLRCKKPSSCKY
jgi:hypothetical protein